jgi:hypothetical protein
VDRVGGETPAPHARALDANLTVSGVVAPNDRVNRSPSFAVVALALLVCALAPSQAHAGTNDISLRGLVDTSDPDAPKAQNEEFRGLVQELGLVMTPTSLQPAETTGQAGFDFALDYNFHLMNYDQPYWQNTRVDGDVPLLMTLGARARKGFVLPVPLASEIEIGAQWLIDSQLLTLGSNIRVALNEGFRWIPDLAVQAGINRVVGSGDLDLLTVTSGAQISKGFGIVGSFNLCPFVGYQSIWVNGSSRIVDANPSNSANVDDNVLFAPVSILDQNNRMDRVSAGLRFVIAVVQITGGVDVNFVNNQPLLQMGLRAGVLL